MANNLKYENILGDEKFKDFMNLINQNIPIVVKHWSDKLGFKNPTSFIGFLKRKNIPYKVSTAINNMSIELKNHIISDYNDDILSVEQILTKYKLSSWVFYKLVGKRGNDPDKRKRGNTILTKMQHNLSVNATVFGQMKELLDKNNIKYEIVLEKNKALNFLVNCSECEKIIKIRVGELERLKEDAKIKCYGCFAKNHSSIKAASKPLNELRNSSGYIGVSIKTRKGKSYGCSLTLEHKRVKLVEKYFSDKTLSDKTLIEAAVYREKFIITNGLPHTRNFSDGELISNMEMLGQYGDIDLIKKKLG